MGSWGRQRNRTIAARLMLGSEHADCGSRALNATKSIHTVPHTDCEAGVLELMQTREGIL